jgi:putative peptidoglycan lipid II flippase
VEIGVNAVLNAVLMRVMGHEGLALATSLSAAVMGVFLVRAVQREFGQVLTSEVGRSLGKALAATAAMAAVVILVRQGVGADSFARLPGGRVAGVLLCVLAGALSYATACVLLRIEELGRVREVWQRRRNSGS